MTGANLCRLLLERDDIDCAVTLGAVNIYCHGERIIVLHRATYKGTDRKSITFAAHEAGHAAQEQTFGWIAPALRWLMPGRLLLEWDASRRARLMLAAQGITAHEDALRDCWRSYLAPALWQAGILAAIGAYLLLS